MKKGKLWVLLAAILAVAVCLVMVVLWIGALQRENEVRKENWQLWDTVQELKNEIEEKPKAYVKPAPALKEAEEPAGESFQYLAIGNSVTENPPYGDVWWGDWGMAASKEEKDYVHRVKAGIESAAGPCEMEVLNFRIWEQPIYEREDHLEYLDGFLSEDTDLVTVQLGENITDMGDLNEEERRAALKRDYGRLLSYIAKRAKNAKRIVLGSVWEEDFRDSVIEEVCREEGAVFVSLKELQTDEYRAGRKKVYGEDNKEHRIEDPGVALHPNDKGMKRIAEMILAAAGL